MSRVRHCKLPPLQAAKTQQAHQAPIGLQSHSSRPYSWHVIAGGLCTGQGRGASQILLTYACMKVAYWRETKSGIAAGERFEGAYTHPQISVLLQEPTQQLEEGGLAPCWRAKQQGNAALSHPDADTCETRQISGAINSGLTHIYLLDGYIARVINWASE